MDLKVLVRNFRLYDGYLSIVYDMFFINRYKYVFWIYLCYLKKNVINVSYYVWSKNICYIYLRWEVINDVKLVIKNVINLCKNKIIDFGLNVFENWIDNKLWNVNSCFSKEIIF